MTIIVSVKINDGIVMASDSASTFGTGQIYLTADKIVNLVKGLPIGIMVTGNGGIGSESIATLLKDLRARLTGPHEWALNPGQYTMQQVAERVREFLFGEKAAGEEVWMQLRLCGYSAGRPLPEIWEIKILGNACDPPSIIRAEDQFGVNWDGEYEPLNRLIFGVGTGFRQVAPELGIEAQKIDDAYQQTVAHMYEHLALSAMPVQDAIDLARYLVETTVGYIRFAISKQPKAVGGPVEIAAITKHEGFKWVQRRHFYSVAINP